MEAGLTILAMNLIDEVRECRLAARDRAGPSQLAERAAGPEQMIEQTCGRRVCEDSAIELTVVKKGMAQLSCQRQRACLWRSR